MSLSAMKDYQFVSKYARYLPDLKRRETYIEAVNRNEEMHLRKYKDLGVDDEIKWAFDMQRQKRVLGSQRNLQFGGPSVESKNARSYNCLCKDTEFITSEGVKTFNDFNDGDSIVVLTHTGEWKKSIVRSYGEDYLNKITIKRGGVSYDVFATQDHRWFLKDGTVTEDLEVYDCLLAAPNILEDFDYDNSSVEERLYWCYGFVYGYGTRTKNKEGEYSHSLVRLCDKDTKYKYRFEEMGFSTSSSLSLKGDLIAFTGKYLKETPDPSVDDPGLIRAFVRGYLDADGEKDRNYLRSTRRIFKDIQSSDVDHIDFIKRCFPIAGVYLVSETDLTGEKTNLGIKGHTKSFRLNNYLDGKHAQYFKVVNIEKNVLKENVWCLEVEDNQSFVFPFGLVTGNCATTYCDRVRAFQEYYWLLLCGCGVGVSVQDHHVAKLPNISKPDKKKRKTFLIPDSIEGWADSLGVLLSSYFVSKQTFPEYKEHYVDFDYSLIRPEGSSLSHGGKAPGHVPLEKGLELIRKILDKSCSEGNSLQPIHCYDILMHASDSVLAGGIRRSASIVLFSLENKEMMNAKVGNWREENPQRGRSNNSAVLLKDKVTFEQFQELIKSTKEFGEPGLLWSDDTEMMFNPCFHKDARLATENGLIRIEDIFNTGLKNRIVIDSRIGKGDTVRSDDFGVKTVDASIVELTQKKADIYLLKTDHGHSVRATLNHEFPTQDGRKRLEDLQIGDILFLQSAEGGWGQTGNLNQGLLLGLLTGDGTFSRKRNKNIAHICVWEDDFDYIDSIRDIVYSEVKDINCNWEDKNTGQSNVCKKEMYSVKIYDALQEICGDQDLKTIKKRVPECVWRGSRELVRGYLQGLFFADGSVQLTGSKKKATLSVRLNQSNELLLQDVQVLLQNFGISSKIYSRRDAGEYLLPDGKGGMEKYSCKENFELIINRPNSIVFQEKIGLFGRKSEYFSKLLDIRGIDCRKPERFISKIKSIEYDCTEDVYCLNQPDSNSVIANGIIAGNCVETGQYPVDIETGESGVQFCNLSTVNIKKCKSEEDFLEGVKAATIIGTLQAGYCDFEYLGKTSENITKREALLGVSMTGIMDIPDPTMILNPETLKKGARLAKKINREIAKKIGINPAARICCLKPEGSGSLVLGVSSSINSHHSKRYLRRLQGNKNEAPLVFFKKFNPLAVEESKWSANNTDEIVTFCINIPDGIKTKSDMTAIGMLDTVKLIQKYWVLEGMNPDLCTKPWLRHNVSNTIQIKDDNEWNEATKYIYKNREYFAGISMISVFGDLDYPQAPNVAIKLPSQLVREYGDGTLMASGLIVDGLHVFDDLWEACDYLVIDKKELEEPKYSKDKYKSKRSFEREYDLYLEQKDWIRRVKQFADRYMDGDVRKVTYLMKEVHNWKLWCDLNREYKDVDYTQMIEEEDNTKLSEEVACAGGACLI